jgi:hypothetical protein
LLSFWTRSVRRLTISFARSSQLGLHVRFAEIALRGPGIVHATNHSKILDRWRPAFRVGCVVVMKLQKSPRFASLAISAYERALFAVTRVHFANHRAWDVARVFRSRARCVRSSTGRFQSRLR